MALGLTQTRALCLTCCNISIAPLRFAAGQRALMAGAPSTTQPVLAEASIDAHSTVPDTCSTSTSTMDANSQGGAASVSHEAVPENLEQLVRVFASHPSVYIPVMALLLLVGQRLQSPWTSWDLGGESLDAAHLLRCCCFAEHSRL